MTFERYWNELRQQDEIRGSEDLLNKVAKILDTGTIKHSKRTAITVAMGTFIGGLEHDISLPLVAGAQLHDLGKHACQDIIMANYVDFSEQYFKYKQLRHPHDGFVIASRHVPSTFISNLAATHVLTHHTHKSERSSNYPTPEILEFYTELGYVTQHDLDLAQQSGPILAHCDLIDAMSHPQERPYMAADESLMPMTYLELIENAALVANRDLKAMPYGLMPQHIGGLLLQHMSLVDAYSAP